MASKWRLKKIAENTIYTQEHLIMCEVLSEVFSMMEYAHNGLLKHVSKTRHTSCDVDGYTISYRYVFDFCGDKVIYIFEREV